MEEDSRSSGAAKTLAEALSALPDFRREHLRVHGLVSVLQMAVAAMLCGVKSKYGVGQWAKERLEDDPALLEALGCPPGRCPSQATIHRVFKGLDAPAFERVLGGWLSQWSQRSLNPSDTEDTEDTDGVRELLAVDGKTLRGIHGEEVPGVHLVAVYALHAQAVLAQMTAGGKGTELVAVKAALGEVDLEETVVLGDALQTQREVCCQIVEGGGDYLFPVKENQPTLLKDLQDAFSPVGPAAGSGRERPVSPAGGPVAEARVG